MTGLQAGGMIGAEALVRTLLASGIDTCFANPGTSEMHFVAALDRHPRMRCVLALFEGVAAGAADGYARIAGRPAAALFHCGPGLANGLAGLHNANRAHTPLVAITGDLATYHRAMSPPLATDVVALAGSATPWVRSVGSAAELAPAAAEAVAAAWAPPGQVATLVVPSDTCWNDGAEPAAPLPRAVPATVPGSRIAETAALLRSGEPTLILLAGAALHGPGPELAWRIAGRTGARLLAEQFNARIERGRGRLPIDRVSYRLEQGLQALAGYRQIVLLGASEPIAFFAYPGQPTTMVPPGCRLHVAARRDEDLQAALRELADHLGCSASDVPAEVRSPVARAAPADRALSTAGVAAALGRTLPDDAIVVDESVSFGRPDWFPHTVACGPHDWLVNAGGSIGHGMPMATGAAVAAPGRRVVCLQADGSAMYTLQSLWTQARERLDVTTVLLSNRKYGVLLSELRNVGVESVGRNARRLIELDDPALDWVRLAEGHGVEAARAADTAQLEDLLRQSFARSGPFLIELQVG